MMKTIVGIDEVGRGPLAGPITVCAVLVSEKNYPKICKILKEIGSGDSKSISPQKREEVSDILKRMSKRGELSFSIKSVSAKIIDKGGISKAAKMAVKNSLYSVGADPKSTNVFLDAGLFAPKDFNQQSIIRGDASHPLIGAASCLAKVNRDALMIRMAKKYTGYGFEKNMGYGTLAHRRAILSQGPSIIHRLSFLKGILGKG